MQTTRKDRGGASQAGKATSRIGITPSRIHCYCTANEVVPGAGFDSSWALVENELSNSAEMQLLAKDPAGEKMLLFFKLAQERHLAKQLLQRQEAAQLQMFQEQEKKKAEDEATRVASEQAAATAATERQRLADEAVAARTPMDMDLDVDNYDFGAIFDEEALAALGDTESSIEERRAIIKRTLGAKLKQAKKVQKRG